MNREEEVEEERREYVRRLVDTFRPLDDREKEKLALLFRRHVQPRPSA